ncbi:MAG: hypothetical protein QNJ40_02185 [Xanthomonadales bacterium]|nr:hypothetical protein [Xanthomonadales bacterium]
MIAGGESGTWKQFVSDSLNLSDTIEVAIWDLWIRNSQNARKDGWSYHPWHFAQNFLDNYFAEGSEVDVWVGDALESAKSRIKEFRHAT